jgi:signal transduction histidine kinase
MSRHPRTADRLLVVAVLAVFEMPGLDPYRHNGGWAWPLLGIGVALPLLWRRQWPYRVLAITATFTGLAIITRRGNDWGAVSPIIILLGLTIALATAASVGPPSRSRQAAFLTAVAILVAMAGPPTGSFVRPEGLLSQVAVIGAAWMAGEAFRARRAEIASLRAWAAHLEADQADQARRAAADERARIARELHDVVAHHIGVIAIQAGAARLSSPEQMSPALTSLSIIETTSRQALADLRRALGVIRRDDRDGSESNEGSGRTPQPGLDGIPDMVARIREAGLPVELSLAGEPPELPDGLALSAYRIVQEALTNVLKHAGSVLTRVSVRYWPDTVELEVVNGAGGRPGQPGSGGRGLIGMRERVAAYQGTLRAGPTSDGGFRVVATLPVGPSPSIR